ncbi:hypothetical protein FFLO_04043 [Filobasidium floriforme]|uniref:Uncharacterized protein n=1 Tax=Filobasidium floriforme TaxID=5210 RepID=A0A8K0JJN5_9TREE|nr:hypothetical protein FFLO_04043 [Filobasidium floriforme]
MKNKGEVRKGEAGKADCTITMPDSMSCLPFRGQGQRSESVHDRSAKGQG